MGSDNFFFKYSSSVTSIDMKDDTTVVKIKFYDPELGREQVVYGEVKETKIDRFENNEDSWITLTDSYRSLTIPKINVMCIRVIKGGNVRYRKSEKKAIVSKNTKDRVGISSS